MSKLEGEETQLHAHLLKYYPCAPGFVKQRMLRLLQTPFLLFQQIFFILESCIHAGNPREPPRVLASGPKSCGGNKSDIKIERRLDGSMPSLSSSKYMIEYVYIIDQARGEDDWILAEFSFLYLYGPRRSRGP